MPYRTAQEVDFERETLAPILLPENVLMVDPEYYDVTYVINPHMMGQIGRVNRARAREQWEKVRAAYETLHLDVHVLPGVKGLPDMVFAANQTLPFCTPDGEKGVILSRMHAEERKPEVPYFEQFFRAQGYAPLEIPQRVSGTFEGGGDAIWHTGRYLLWVGYGYRTDYDVLKYLEERLDVPVMALHLTDPDFYHLDTCFSVLNEETVLIFPGAFTAEGLGLIERVFTHVIYAPEEEARRLFACNAHCPDGKHVLIQEGCTVTNQRLEKAGFIPVELDTSEFLKAGGSVYCLKQMYW